MKSQPKVIFDKLPTQRDGENGDMRLFEHKGNYYIAVKIKGNWVYFKETGL